MLAVLMAQLAVASVPSLGEERLPSGAPIELMVLTEVSADRARTGDVVKLMLNKAVERGGRTLIAAGAPAFGEVVAADKSGPALKAGKLNVRLVRLVVDGQDLPIDGSVQQTGKGGNSDDAIKVVLVPLYALFSPGNSGKLKAGELIHAALTHAYAYRTDEPGVPKLHEVSQTQMVMP